MADRVVLDASIAVALLVEEVGSPAARRLAGRWLDSPTQLLVPGHFWLELTNVLVRRKGVTPPEALEGLVLLDAFEPETVEVDRPALLLALGAMSRHALTAYDAAYVALAQVTGSRLATFDSRLAAAALEMGVAIEPSGAHRLADSRAPYAADRESSSWILSSAVGRYISDLRRSIETGAAS